MWPEISAEEWTAVLDETAREVLAECGWSEPPVDALAVAARQGMVVAMDNQQTGRARCVRLPSLGRPLAGVARSVEPAQSGGQPLILLREDPRPERQHWAVAHEIGEHVSHRVFAALSIDPREVAGARERVANQLAARILLPREPFEQAYRESGGCLRTLKARFSTASHELIAKRMLDVAAGLIVAVFDQGKLAWRRSNVPGRLPPWQREEQATWQRCHQTGQTAEACTPRHSITAWAIHESPWQREIVRTAIPTDWE